MGCAGRGQGGSEPLARGGRRVRLRGPPREPPEAAPGGGGDGLGSLPAPHTPGRAEGEPPAPAAVRRGWGGRPGRQPERGVGQPEGEPAAPAAAHCLPAAPGLWGRGERPAAGAAPSRAPSGRAQGELASETVAAALRSAEPREAAAWRRKEPPPPRPCPFAFIRGDKSAVRQPAFQFTDNDSCMKIDRGALRRRARTPGPRALRPPPAPAPSESAVGREPGGLGRRGGSAARGRGAGASRPAASGRGLRHGRGGRAPSYLAAVWVLIFPAPPPARPLLLPHPAPPLPVAKGKRKQSRFLLGNRRYPSPPPSSPGLGTGSPVGNRSLDPRP